MASFRDGKERTWLLTVNVGTCKRVKVATGVDLLQADTAALFTLLGQDLGKFCEVLWHLVQRPDGGGVSEEEFYAGLAGDVLDEATNAFVEALLDFFPRLKRTAAKRLAARTMAMVDAASQAIAEMSDEALDRVLRTSTPTEPGSTSAPWPAGSESSPTPGPSGS